MKKFNTASADLGGGPITKGDLRVLFNSEIWDGIEALLSPFDSDTQGVVLSGCIVTANAGNFDMTAGIVYMNGELLRVPSYTNIGFTKYIAQQATVYDSRTFADGTNHPITADVSAQLQSSAPGSGQYLTISSLTDLDDRRWLGKWNSVTLALTDLQNQSAVNPTVMTSGKFNYRLTPGRLEIDIDIYGLTFGTTPSQIYVLVPSAIRAFILAFMRNTGSTGARLFNGQADPSTGTFIPAFVGYSSSKTSLLFAPTTSNFGAASPISLSTQFYCTI